MSRDMTQKQFDAALEKRGMKKLPFMGYVDIGGGRHVSVLNAGIGSRRRDQLAYLIQHQNKMLAEQEREAKAAAIDS